MSSEPNRLSKTISNRQESCQDDPIYVDVTIDINDIGDGALKVLKHIKPFWPINDVQFKVGFSLAQFFFSSSPSTVCPISIIQSREKRIPPIQ